MALRPLAKVIRLAGLKVKVNKAGTQAQVTFPGFSSDDIDRTGNISIWRIQRYLTGARIAAYHVNNPETGHTFLEYDKLTEDLYTFMASTSTDVSREIYNIPDADSFPPLLTTVHLGYVGNSSLNSVAVLQNAETGQEYARNTNQVVTVSQTTRKPTPLLSWWKEKYGDAAVEKRGLFVEPLSPPPEKDVYSYDMKVPWSEIDAYRHTNYASYVRFCFDAAMDAMQAGALTKFPPGGDILKHHVSKLRVSFKGETKAGDKLVVRTWENKDNPYLLHFDITKDGRSVNQNTMEFYES